MLECLDPGSFVRGFKFDKGFLVDEGRENQTVRHFIRFFTVWLDETIFINSKSYLELSILDLLIC